MTKLFHFTADFVFRARDIDDAFAKVAAHFHWLSSSRACLSEELEFVGKAEIKPVSDEN